MTTIQKHWWQEAIIYQIYPRSFQDSNGDGIGDLKGITSRLDYIRSLGVDVIWLNPIFASPNDDMGYDISDYRAIMKEFGTMDDFDELLREVHIRGMKLILDLVVNHTSDEHYWFQEARKSRSNPYYSYYHWWPVEKEHPQFRPSYFEESAWQYNAHTRSWYLHYFSRKQPDLNWENPRVRQEIYDMMYFWFEKGIDGFRMDSIPLIAKDPSFPPIDRKKYPDLFSSYAHGPHLHDYLHEMNREVLSRYDIMTVGEGSAVTYKEVALFVEPDRQELNMLYGFGPSEVRNYTQPDDPESGIGFSLVALKKMFADWDRAVGDGWPAVYLGNHDQPRMISRFGNDGPAFREISAKMLATFLLTLRGTPYWFAGDEIGMVNPGYGKIEDYRDVATLNQYRQVIKGKGNLQAFLEQQKQLSRDNGRSPMQWDRSLFAGFSQVTPWLGCASDYTEWNVEKEENKPDSVLNYFRQVVAIRKNNRVLTDGDFILIDEQHPQVFAYLRKNDESRLLILHNFSSKSADFRINSEWQGAEWLIGNYSGNRQISRDIHLRPYESLIYKLR